MSKKKSYFFNVLDFRVVFFVFVFSTSLSFRLMGAVKKNIKHVSSRNVLCAGL